LTENEAKEKAEALRLMIEEMKASRKRPLGPSSSLPLSKAPKHSANESRKPKENPYLAYTSPDNESSEFVDDRIISSDKRRIREQHAFQFVPKGQYVEAANVFRAREAHQEFINNKKSKDARRHFRMLVDGEPGADIHSPAIEIARVLQQTIPQIEWWDMPFASQKSTEQATFENLKIENQKTFKLVEHPTFIKPLIPLNTKSRSIPLYLTKKERRRIRRQKRSERQQDMRDQVAAGLMPPPPPKVKLSNLMRVLGEQAVADPSRLEKEVYEQTQARIKNHEMRNLASKLTPAEKWEKKQKKIREDSVGAPTVTVYWVHNICNPAEIAASNRFKIDVNAQKFGLTGCLVAVSDESTKGANLVLVEGGERASTKFEQQMLKRIKWPGFNGSPGCLKMWSGKGMKSFHSKFEFHDFTSVDDARKFCRQKGIVDYFDMIC